MKSKTRGNGQGTAYRRPGQTTWTVEVVVGWKYPDGDPTKPKRPVRKKKGGFKTKREALEYAAVLRRGDREPDRATLEEVYLSWKPYYSPRVDASTMNCYVSAYKHFAPLHGLFMDAITVEDLQACLDNCPSGKRTRQNMRTTAGLLWHYAMDRNLIAQDITANLYTGRGASVKREAITPEEEETIFRAIGRERYAEYIYCLIYLGFRPGEFLQLKKEQLFYANLAKSPSDPPIPVWYFINGKKTEAGRNRTVVIPEQILPMILSRALVPGTDLLFPQYQFDRKKENLLFFKKMTDNYFREMVFKPMMSRLGIAAGKVPYGARHSFTNKLKNASGSDRDKAELVGHTSYAFTQKAYQTSDLADLKKIVDSF